MGVAIVALLVSIILIFVAPPVGIVAAPLCAIWVVLAFVFKVLGWGFGGKRS
ncbi:MAG: hypothetical protein ABJ215_02435 [Alphaproteobacteria bacterium]